ncbi:MAG: hypothetical protein ABI950_03460, partial [Solirubrobacteraceae bacterium]
GAKAMRGVGLRVAGAEVRARTKRTGRRGTAVFRLRPSRRGTVVVRAAAKGYRTMTLRLAVR